MKLMKHIIFVDLGDSNWLMINSLRGTMDELDSSTFEKITCWKKDDKITIGSEADKELVENLKLRGYLVKDEKEENEFRENILKELRKVHAQDRLKCKHVTFVMTYDCNFRCPYCFEGDVCLKQNVITPEMIDEAFSLVGKDVEGICLFGGEPLLPKTKDSIKYIVSKMPDKSYSIFTNGYYIDEFIDILKTLKIDHITITLDGFEDTHNSKRPLAGGGATYQKVLSGITTCLTHGISTRIRINVEKDNFYEGVRLQEMLTEKFAEFSGLVAFEMTPHMGYTNEAKNDMMTEIFCSDVEHGYEKRVRRNRQLSGMSPIIRAISLGAPMKPLYSFCYAHENKLAFDPYGNIFTCFVTVGKDELAAGKYYPDVKFFDNSILNRNIDKIPQCRECIYAFLCGGGCPMYLPSGNDMFKPSCKSIHSQIHDLLPKFYNAERKHNCP